MELGFARFLEMFEERFGHRVTTAILGLVGLALAIYSVEVILSAIAAAYGVIKSANLLAALKQESAASHIVIFLAQITLTFLALWFIWRQFYRRKLEEAENALKAGETRINELMNRVKNSVANYREKVQAFENREDRLADRMEELKKRHEELLAAYIKKLDPPTED